MQSKMAKSKEAGGCYICRATTAATRMPTQEGGGVGVSSLAVTRLRLRRRQQLGDVLTVRFASLT